MTEEIQDIKEIPRYEATNSFNYSKLDLAKRKKAIMDAERDFPNVPAMWIEWAYDLTENMDKKELEEIINEGKWEKNPKERQLGGSVKCLDVINS